MPTGGTRRLLIKHLHLGRHVPLVVHEIFLSLFKKFNKHSQYMNSAMFYGRTSSETKNNSSESDISCNSSDEYEPSSYETEDANSS